MCWAVRHAVGGSFMSPSEDAALLLVVVALVLRPGNR